MEKITLSIYVPSFNEENNIVNRKDNTDAVVFYSEQKHIRKST